MMRIFSYLAILAGLGFGIIPWIVVGVPVTPTEIFACIKVMHMSVLFVAIGVGIWVLERERRKDDDA